MEPLQSLRGIIMLAVSLSTPVLGSYVFSENPCPDGTAIASWEECKTANADQASPVTEAAEFADNNWHYGCIIILAQNKLYFNGQIDATAKVDQLDFLCTPPQAACDASAAPANGASGDCTDSLPNGTTCRPVCDSGFELSGSSSCNNGELAPARCQAATSYVSEPLCLDGMAISSWEECKTANANQPSPVPEEAEFADNNWPYGCFTILAQNKLYFNGQIDATATGDEVAREVEFVCTGKTGRAIPPMPFVFMPFSFVPSPACPLCPCPPASGHIP